MEILFEQTNTTGTFYIERAGERLGVMTFSKVDEKQIIIEHTVVAEALRGKGAGKQLVAAGVAYARANGLKIIPHCTFANTIFDNTPAYADVLSK